MIYVDVGAWPRRAGKDTGFCRASRAKFAESRGKPRVRDFVGAAATRRETSLRTADGEQLRGIGFQPR